jgi:hypothetical protein
MKSTTAGPALTGGPSGNPVAAINPEIAHRPDQRIDPVAHAARTVGARKSRIHENADRR